MIKTLTPIQGLIHLPSQLLSALSRLPRPFLKLGKSHWELLILFLDGSDMIQLLQLNKKTWELRLHKPIERMLVSEQQRLLMEVLKDQEPFKKIDQDSIEIQYVPRQWQWQIKKETKISFFEFIMGKAAIAKLSPIRNLTPEKKNKSFASKLCPAKYLKDNYPKTFEKYFSK